VTGAQVHVLTGALSDGAQTVVRAADRFGESLDSVDRVVRELAADWTGAASEEFQQAAARWRSASNDLHASLLQVKALLLTAHDNYAAAESANVRMWRAR
jgi:WXG100 family type VII secretion target